MAFPTWVSQVSNATLNMTSSTFSFQNALNPSGIENTFGSYYEYIDHQDSAFFFRDACRQHDGTQNCTAACQDRDQVFGSLDTLHNCMVYPALADLYASNSMNNTSLPKDYNIQKSRVNSTLYKNITTTIQKCLMDICNVTSGCVEGLKQWDSGRTQGSLLDSPSNITSTFYLFSTLTSSGNRFDFCDFIPGSLNQDIGGIGVYVSYWIQTGLALLCFLMVVWWNWGLYYVCFGALLLPRGYSKAKKYAQRSGNRYRNKHLPSLTGAMAEFQKAQCFFMLAINIAALVNRSRGGFQPSNLQQLYNTYVLIKSISISGYLPVTFTLFTLHLVDVVSWYLLVLSTVTVLVSIATLFVLGSFSPSQDDLDYLSLQSLKDVPDSCGKRNLAVYCYKPVTGENSYDSTDPASGAYSMLAFCLVVLILLIAHQYHAFRDPSTGQPKPWLSKTLRVFFRKYNVNLRRVQLVFALISTALNGYVVSLSSSLSSSGYDDYYFGAGDLGAPGFILFASCWTVSFVLYLFLTSGTDYTRTDKPVGRFYNQRIAFAVDCLSAVFWFAGFISLAQYTPDYSGIGYDVGIYGVVITGVLLAVCLCITFVVTAVLAGRHMLRARNEHSEKHAPGKRYWFLQALNKHRLRRRLSQNALWWRHLIEKVFNKLPSWTKHPRVIDAYNRLEQNSHRAYQDLKNHASTLNWPSTMIWASVFSMYLIFFGLYIHWFKIYIQDLEWFAYNGVQSSSWSFGQIVAISVWAEPLCEYFHLEFRGMTRGFEHRLWGYTVVRIKPPPPPPPPPLDVERGVVVSEDSSSSPHRHHPPSGTDSLLDGDDGREMGEYGKLGVVDPAVEDRGGIDYVAVDRKDSEAVDRKDGGDGDLAVQTGERWE